MANKDGQVWEAYWTDLPDRAGAAFWDCEPADGAAAHAELFKAHFDPQLPLVDLGCGNGTQTKYLAGLYDRVVGVDIAEAALKRARAENPAANVAYELLDVLDDAAVRAFHERHGDVNIYLSGVIHQLPVDRRVACTRNLAVLAGTRGCVFDQELTPASYTYMQRLIADPANDLPKLERVSIYFGIGLQPAAGEAELETVYEQAGFTITEGGELRLRTTETLADGANLDLPTHYVIARA
ncbi:Methyltransferase domain-containing protein [Amycolatopsis australiensis]|uniref:Methyltransferase domain-containing protein n=2 Tax=Amycolatopsis australiensis TaxID=546364 RepID=A0A1K1RUI6_9PSEU|nr:Methyltransferase domain-containing protein [Amycolatopsis australiensis]